MLPGAMGSHPEEAGRARVAPAAYGGDLLAPGLADEPGFGRLGLFDFGRKGVAAVTVVAQQQPFLVVDAFDELVALLEMT